MTQIYLKSDFGENLNANVFIEVVCFCFRIVG